MKKLTLRLDDLQVESFDPDPSASTASRGTVRAHGDTMPYTGLCQGTEAPRESACGSFCGPYTQGDDCLPTENAYTCYGNEGVDTCVPRSATACGQAC